MPFDWLHAAVPSSAGDAILFSNCQKLEFSWTIGYNKNYRREQ
jgi:hypothetical protein